METSTQCLYNEPRSALWHKHRATLDNLHDVRDELVIGAGGPHHIKVAFLNVRGLTIDKLDYILWYYEHAKLDVLLLIDVQLTREDAYFKKAEIHERVGNDRRVDPVRVEVATDDVRVVGVLHVSVDSCFKLLLHESLDGAADVLGLLVLFHHGP